MSRAKFTPIQMVNVEHVIDREYRNSPSFQWARELLQNAIEAGATRVEFDLEWQAVTNRGVYRRTCIDDGCGMSPHELKAFFSKLGHGSKTIGGAHDNYGIGAKNNLLPWNKAGLVVVSLKDQVTSMVVAKHFPESGSYGLVMELLPNDRDSVYQPWDDSDGETGCNWAALLPDWVHDAQHGTAVVMLGNDLQQDTILGDPDRWNEGETRGLYAYLNRRYFSFPAHVEKVTVTHMHVADRSKWPRERRLGYSHGAQRRAITPREARLERAINTDVVELTDGTRAWVYLMPEGIKADRKTEFDGSIGALYRGELYDLVNQMYRHRQFGVVEREVAVRTWVLLEPPLAADDTFGVAPTTGRADLKWLGASGAEDLPWHSWGAEFASRMPHFLADALRAVQHDDQGQLADMRHLAIYGASWQRPILVADDAGQDETTPDASAELVRTRKPVREPAGGEPSKPAAAPTGSPNVSNQQAGEQPAEQAKNQIGIPDHYWRPEDHFDDPAVLAEWNDPSSANPRGAVYLNRDHAVLAMQVARWQGRYADHLAEEVAKCVRNAYASKAISMCAHIEQQRRVLGTDRVGEMRSPVALTTGLMGLVGEDSIIDKLTRFVGKRDRR